MPPPIDISSLSDKKRALLDLLRKERQAQTPNIPRVADSGPAPLSSAQQRLWFIEQLEPGNSAYNVAVAHRLSGPLDAGVLEKALRVVVLRHEPLRSYFESCDGRPVQKTAPDSDFTMELVDLTQVPSAERLAEAIRLATERAMRPFSLTRGPLFRATLFQLAPEEHVIHLDVHHIVSDGSSMNILYRELSLAYNAIRSGAPIALPDLPIRYADFVTWQQGQLSTDLMRQQLDYWRRSLAGVPDTLLMPTDHPRPARQQFAGAKQFLKIPGDLASELKRFSATNGVTLFTALAGAFGLLLNRYSGQGDFVIGFPVAGRNVREVEPLIGLFVNMLPLRFEIPPEGSFTQLLASVGKRVLDATENQDVPLEQILEALHVERDPSRTPLFQTVFSLNHHFVSGPAFPGVSAEPLLIDTGTAKFDLSLEVMDERTGLYCSLEYNTSLFEERTARRMLGHYENLLRSALASPSVAVARLPLASDSEIQDLLRFGTGVRTDFHRERSLPEQFEDIAAQSPDAVAAIFCERQITYSELNQRANSLAHYLQQRGCSAGAIVGGSLERSIDMLVSLLAVLKTGACYLPLDPSYPSERLRFMVEDAGASFVISANEPKGISDLAVTICLDAEKEAIARHHSANLGVHVNSEKAAYVIYTSGSTGRPKGILIPHLGIARLMRNASWLSITPSDRFSHVSNISFDAALLEIWGTLLNGATIVGFARESLLDAHQFVNDLRRFKISRTFLTTAFFNQLTREIPDAFRTVACVLFGGEVCDPRAVRTVLKHGPANTLLHLYGPAECTILATYYDCANLSEEAETTPIGKPISNTDVLILDDYLQPTPMGVIGQIYLAGDGVALGYLRRPELTRERFIDHPFVAGARLYATGDLGYFSADGNIEFCGRKDNQIKLRGFRIELDEIEAVCRTHREVTDAVVLLRKDSPQNQRIVAFVIRRQSSLISSEIHSYLKEKLPAYMVPALVVVLDKFPVTANGKIDRAGLKSMSLDECRPDSSFLPPQTDLEKTIARIWQELLGVSGIGRTENFFELGGHSILLLRVQSRLEEALGRDIPVIALFEHPTVAALAEHLSGAAISRGIECAPPKAHKQEPIAIIGMAGRFPGADNIDQLWRNLRAGISGIRFFSDDELEAAGVPREAFSQPNYVKAGGVMNGAALFDARFFGMNPREAEITDPQHRVFLECAHEALDNAGCDPSTYRGSIGVFAGCSAGTYIDNIRANEAVAQTAGPLQMLVGNDKDFLPTRVSYKLNLRGPSVNVQTACSTSLVAVHFACHSLLEHACDTALAGGVSIRFPQPSGYPYLEESIMAPDGCCRTFDANAHGTVPGNGAAVVVLKRLSDALVDGDHIYAVIKGSAINNDGSLKVGYTAPSVEGQAQVIVAAQAAAGADPSTITYVEAHGTGTHLGDPIEIAALTKAFRARTDRTGFCAIGSAKSNLGHLDAAAGVTGLIKTALQLHHKEIVPSLHFERPNPKIDFANSPFFVNTVLRDWDTNGEPRRAAVSSFGIGGTNAHVILEEAPQLQAAEPVDGWHILPLSAKTEQALKNSATNLADYLRANPESRLADVAYTLQTGRTAHKRRIAVVCETPGEAIEVLANPLAISSVSDEAAPSLAFLFPGQGSQYVGMAHDLYNAESVFRHELDRCADILVEHLGGLDIRSLIYPAASRESDASDLLNQTAVTQPVLFAVEYALAQLWQSWGVRPNAMIGHSIGEYVVACLAGVMSLEDALRLVARRGRLMQDLPPGAMLAVSMSERDALAFAGTRLSVAAVNAPEMCVLSGPEDRIAAAEQELSDRIFHRRLRTSHAFHSEMVEPALKPFEEELRSVPLRAPQIPYISNVTGTWITPGQATSPEYWATHLRNCVRFGDGVAELLKQDSPIFLEIGPGNTLATLVASQQPNSKRIISLAGKRGEVADSKAMRIAAGRLWAEAISLNWSVLRGATGCRHIPLPTYPFERERYWIEPSVSASTSAPLVKKIDLGQWLYEPSWVRSATVPESVAGPEERCVIFTDDGGVGQHLADDLSRNGNPPFIVRRGPNFAKIAGQEFTVNPASPKDFRDLVASLTQLGTLPQRFLLLWDITTEKMPAEHTLDFGYYSLLWLVQALSSQAATPRAEITLVANRMFPVMDGDVPDPVKAAVLGVCRVVSQEFPEIRCRAIDVDLANPVPQISSQVRFECSQPAGTDAVAYRGRFRWKESFEQVQVPAAGESPAVQPRGVWLVTGGLGGVGLELAGYLAHAAQARLILLGRTGLPPRAEWDSWIAQHDVDDALAPKIRKIREMEKAGAEVLIATADLSDIAQVSAAVDAAERKFGRVRGVIHAAAIAGGGLIDRQSKTSSSAVFAAKIAGTLNLAQVFTNRPVDFFVLCSSQRSVIGAPGRVEYCAANAFLDAAAQTPGYLPGRSVISIAWDTWAESGMGLGLSLKAGAELVSGEAGIGMTNEEGIEIFQRLLANPRPCVVVSTLDLRERIERHRSLTTERVLQVFGENRAPCAVHERPDLSTPYVAPASLAERKLAVIWSELLGIAHIGVHDNFFDLGGDSVIAIQIVARANEAGFRLSPRNMFQHQNIAELAAADPGKRNSAWQAAVPGPVALTPIQQWFFEQRFTEVNHFNLVILLANGSKIVREHASEGVRHLATYHDALRLRFCVENSCWTQTNQPVDPDVPFQVADLSRVPDRELLQAIDARCREAQTSLSITRGPMFRAVLLECGPGRPDRLLFVVHHLACDLITLQILVQDFETAYEQLTAGQPVQLPPKTTSFQEWSKILMDKAAKGAFDAEVDYWASTERRSVPGLPLHAPDEAHATESAVRPASVSLTVAETAHLMHELPRIAGVDVRSILLSALTEALASWSGNSCFLVDVEGLGREGAGADVDLSRTVGWFTSLYPVYLDRRPGGSLEDLPRQIASDLQAIPNHGIGYGALRYLNAGSAVASRLATMPQAQVSFLYRGASAATQSALFRATADPCGPMHAPSIHLTHSLAVDASVSKGCLQVTWICDPLRLGSEATRLLIREFEKALRTLIQRCCTAAPKSFLDCDAAEFQFDESDLAQIAASLSQVPAAPGPNAKR